MARRMEWDDGFGNTLVLARTWPETVALYCDECGEGVPGNQYWGLDRTKHMHEQRGHKVRRLAMA